jgi:membrane-bound serine protease (ClpP class)
MYIEFRLRIASLMVMRGQIISYIADPNVAFALILLGVLAVYWEMIHPGRVIPGAMGGAMALLGLHAISVLPLDWRGILLLLVAAPLLTLEARFALRGIAGVVGATAMASGSFLLVQDSAAFIHWGTAVGITLPFSAITVYVLRAAFQARRNKRLRDL